MTDETAKIAAGLSEGDADCILSLSECYGKPKRGTAINASNLAYGPPITEFRHERFDSRARLYRLTTLGLAVRKHLMENDDG